MHLLLLIVVWIIAGYLAKLAVPGEGPSGALGDLVVGIIGSILGGWLLWWIVGPGVGGWIGSILVSFVGGVIFLLILRALTGRRVA